MIRDWLFTNNDGDDRVRANVEGQHRGLPRRNFLKYFKVLKIQHLLLETSDVKSSRTRWPRGQHFVLGLGLGLRELSSTSASSICPRHDLERFIFAS